MSIDARLLASFPAHPKTKKLLRRLGPAGPWALVCLFLWARANRSDGDLTGMSAEDIELACDWTGDDGAFVSALIDVGFLDGADDAYQIHDWCEHQPWSAGSSRRSEVARENASKKWGVDLSRQNRAKRSERLADARRLGTHTAVEWGAMVRALGSKCLACGSQHDICKDHVRPLYLGGSDGIDNLQPLCRSCNSKKKCGPGNEPDFRPSDWPERLRVELFACGVDADALPNACKTPANDEKTPAPSPSPLPSPSPSPRDSGASATATDIFPASPATPARRSPIELRTWLDSLPEDEDPIPGDDPIIAYAESVGIPHDWLVLAWQRFKADMIERKTKKRDWRAHYRNAVRGNWYRLWWIRDGQSGLTTVGEQARRAA